MGVMPCATQSQCAPSERIKKHEPTSELMPIAHRKCGVGPERRALVTSMPTDGGARESVDSSSVSTNAESERTPQR